MTLMISNRKQRGTIVFSFRSRVSREDVLWCYHYLLGRMPESDFVVEQKLAHKTFRSLVDDFVRSDEFQKRKGEGGLTEADIRWCYQKFAPDVVLTPSVMKEKLRLRNLRQILQDLVSSSSISDGAASRTPQAPKNSLGLFSSWFKRRPAYASGGNSHPSVLIGIPIKNCSEFIEKRSSSC